MARHLNDYVQLHQPHPFFTAGNIKWNLGKERGHLAGKNEVLDHLRHCMAVIKRRIRCSRQPGREVILNAGPGTLFMSRDRAHYRRVLDTVAQRYGARCAPVIGTDRSSRQPA